MKIERALLTVSAALLILALLVKAAVVLPDLSSRVQAPGIIGLGLATGFLAATVRGRGLLVRSITALICATVAYGLFLAAFNISFYRALSESGLHSHSRAGLDT